MTKNISFKIAAFIFVFSTFIFTSFEWMDHHHNVGVPYTMKYFMPDLAYGAIQGTLQALVWGFLMPYLEKRFAKTDS